MGSLARLGLLATGLTLACGGGGAGSDGADTDATTSSDTAGGNCGAAVCGPHEVCVPEADPPRCDCAPAYTGASCDDCAPGYVDPQETGTCTPIVVDCDEPGICEPHGTCVETPGMPDRCDCVEGYTGPTCAQCADGLQDNDENGTCEPGCDMAMIECESPLTCVDDSGTAQCGCPNNTDGEECQYCRENFARIADGPCYQTCPLDCAEPSTCFDDSRRASAICMCPAGHAGAACDECLPEYVMAPNGRCALVEAPPQMHLLMQRFAPGAGATLTAVDPDSGDFIDLFELESPVTQPMTWRSDAGEVYTIGVDDPTTLHRIDLVAATSTEVGTLGGDVWGLVYDPDRGSFLSTGQSSGATIYEWDPGSGATTQYTTDLVANGLSLAHRAGAEQILGAATLTGSITLYEFDLAAQTATELGAIDAFDSSMQTFGFVVDPLTDRAFSTGRRIRTTDELVEERCREAASRLGFDADGAPATVAYLHNGAPAGGFLLESTTTGPEILAYGSYDDDGDPSDGLLRVASSNPDAFLCLFTYEEPLEIRIEPGAVWAGGIVTAYAASLTASIQPGWNAAVPPLHVRESAPADGSFAAAPAAFRILDTREWSDRVIPDFAGFDSSNDLQPPWTLYELDLDAREILATHPIDPTFHGSTLTAWRP